MIRVVLCASVTAFFITLLQISVFSHIRFFCSAPDFILLLILYVSITNGSLTGLLSGFIAGLFLDFLSAVPLGLNSFILTLIGFSAGKICGRYNINKFIFPCSSGFLGMIGKTILLFMLHACFGQNIKVYTICSVSFFVETALNILLAPAIFAFLDLFPSFYKAEENPVI